MSGPGFPFSAGASVGIGPSAGIALNVSSVVAQTPGQTFQTVSLPNTQLALYTLLIRGPSPSTAVKYGYTFPLSPQSVNQDFTAKTQIWDVAGSPQQQGVQRVVDFYGNTPKTFVLEGTTGWQYHSTDGLAYTGMQSISLLQNLLAQFAILNQQQVSNNNPNLYTMEFYDYFSSNFWQVIPSGRQVIRQDHMRPLLFFYSFRLVGVQELSAPTQPETNDPIANALSVVAPQAAVTLSGSLSASLTSYASNTPGSLGVAII
jgi:hypothetical protein